MRKFDVMAAGHLCLDIIPVIPDTGTTDIGRILAPGKLVHVDAPKLSTGGAVSNTGLALEKLGLKTCFCAKLGDDEFGRLTINCLGKSGSSESINICRGHHSSYSIVIAPPGIDRIFLHCPGSNDFFSAEDIDFELLCECRHFHFGYPQLMKSMFSREGEELVKIFKKAREAGASTSCDLALPDPESEAGKAPWRRILEKVLPYVDVFLPSIEEAFYCLEPERFLALKREHANAELIDFLTEDDYARIGGQLLAMGAGMTSLKSGVKGWYFRTARPGKHLTANLSGRPEAWTDREVWCPAWAIDEIKSATGSGDSSIAGFLAGFLKGLTLEDSLRCAACLGWQNLHAFDAVSGIRSWPETLDLLKKDLPLIKPGLGPEWRVGQRGLFTGPRNGKGD